MPLFFNDPQQYWNSKLSAYFHDPIDKIFRIQEHEERAGRLLDVLGVQKPNEKYWSTADSIAAGFERGQVPSYSKDEKKNGAVNFLEYPVITHPTTDKNDKRNPLWIILPEKIKTNYSKKNENELSRELYEYIEKTLGKEVGDEGYSNAEIFRSNVHTSKGANLYAQARFYYSHLILRHKLAQDNLMGLGAFWHRIPADSRFPDHSIWQHNALTSALYSSIEIAGKIDEVGLMVFSLTPVQSFISKARKLRDHWVGSLILSWLAFEGILFITEELGPDHIVYPSLIDQPLVNRYLEKEWGLTDAYSGELNKDTDIASFPNKFVAVIPLNKYEEIQSNLKDRVNAKWKELYSSVKNFLFDALKDSIDDNFFNKKYLASLFDKQCSSYWDMQFSASKLVNKENMNNLHELFEDDVYKKNKEVSEIFDEMLKNKGYETNNYGVFYEISHRIAQSALAAKKLKRIDNRQEELGEKCPLCGEFEVIHGNEFTSGKAGDYKDDIKKFWKELRNKFDDSEFSEHERLCSICTVKRLIHRAMKKSRFENHLLYNSFQSIESYPTTTYLALHSYFNRMGITEEKEKKDISNTLFNTDDSVKGISEKDKYYAILMMDGDHMGKLVNGEKTASTWDSIMHPLIKKRLSDDGFDINYHQNWEKIFNNEEYNKRYLTPSVHAAISESLGDFSLYGVKHIIHEYEGKLIYAGGDDVCAVIPVENAVNAAQKIAEYYTSAFRIIHNNSGNNSKNNFSQEITGQWKPEPGKMSINLGVGKNVEGISISAGILICHHKESLKDMLSHAHVLLDTYAKEKGERNTCAIELKKRSGGSRFFYEKFTNRGKWEAFDRVGKKINLQFENGIRLTSSLVYRLQQYEDLFKTVINEDDKVNRTIVTDNLIKLISFYLKRSMSDKEISIADVEQLARDISVLISDLDKKCFNPEVLIVSTFLGKEREA